MIKREYYSENQVLLMPGQIANWAWFIENGAAMNYTYEGEKKVPSLFWRENEIIVPLKSFLNQIPAESYIELLEPSILISVSYNHVNQIMKSFPASNDYIKRIMEKYKQSQLLK